MAGKTQSPRQKLINMMYLVLTALLALNVSKDVLDAFVVVNQGLETNLVNSDTKSDEVYQRIELANTINPQLARPYWEKAREIRALSAELNAYLESLKTELISATEDIPLDVADTIALQRVDRKDNYDVPTQIMVGLKEDGSAGKARELKGKINAYRQRLVELLGGDEHTLDNIGLATEDVPGDGYEGHWELHNFHYTPLVASVTILSKLQNDVRSAELFATGQLAEVLDQEYIPVDTIAAKVMPRSTYVMMGEEYQSEIYLAAYSKTVQPEVLIGDLDPATGKLTRIRDSLHTEKGVAQMRFKAEREGFQQYSGVINYPMKDGKVLSFPFTSEYLVARPSAVVSPTKMNVLYRGIGNPLEISVPGVPLDDISVSIDGGNRLRKVGPGQYVADMAKRSNAKATVTVSARNKDGQLRNMGNMEFRVRRLPKPYATVGGISTSGRMSKNELIAHGKVRIIYEPDFPFDLKAKVRTYKVTILRRNGMAPGVDVIRGGTFTREIKEMIRGMRTGEKILFEEIKAVGEDGVAHEMGVISITIQ
ncbi:MAG: gliding motility protein GldM [Bacteroidota bacterium]